MARLTPTFDSIKKELERYQFIVQQYTACKSLYDDIQPKITPAYSNEPPENQELHQIERVVEKRLPVMANMEKSLRDMKLNINRIERLITYAGDDLFVTTLSIRYLYGKTIEQTASIMGCEPRTVANRQKQGIKNIVENIKKLN